MGAVKPTQTTNMLRHGTMAYRQCVILKVTHPHLCMGRNTGYLSNRWGGISTSPIIFVLFFYQSTFSSQIACARLSIIAYLSEMIASL